MKKEKKIYHEYTLRLTETLDAYVKEMSEINQISAQNVIRLALAEQKERRENAKKTL